MDNTSLLGVVRGERTVIEDLGRIKTPKGYKTHYVLVRCSCGAEKKLPAKDFLITSRCPSCRNRKLSSEYTVTHGKTDTKVYYAWQHMKNRTSNPKAANYSYYGGRGIKMCERWEEFENFYEDMGEPPTELHTLERIDVDGDYGPDNCVWATKKEQTRNRRVTKKCLGKPVAEWAEILGCSYKFASWHLYEKGRSPEEVKSLWESKQQETK